MRAVIKYLAGLAAFFPGVIALFIFGFYAIYPLPSFPSGEMPSDSTSPVEIISRLFGPVLPFCAMMAIVFALSAAIVVGYVIHAVNGGRVAADKKGPWVVAMVFGAPTALPIYWYVHVWSAPGVGASPMALSRSGKLALGVGSLATLLLSAAIFASSVFTGARAFSTAVSKGISSAANPGKMSQVELNREAQRMQHELSAAVDPGMHLAQRVSLANILLRVVLATIIASHAFRTPRLAKNSRILWVILLVLFSRVVMPIYWYLYIWKENDDGAPTGGAAPPAVGRE